MLKRGNDTVQKITPKVSGDSLKEEEDPMFKLTPERAKPAFWERLWRTIGYSSMGLTGVATVVAVPSAIGFELGWWVIVWAGFLLAGVPAAVCAWRGRYRGEYIALPFVMGALVIYDIFLWIQATYEPLNMAAAFLVMGFAGKLASRLAHLNNLVKRCKEGL